MVEAEFVLRCLEAVLDGPAMPFHADEGFHGRACRAPRREEGQIAIGDLTPDQQTAGPRAGQAIGIFVSIKVGEFETDPVVKPGSLGVVACRQAMPCVRIRPLAICAAVPATTGLLPHEPKRWSPFTPSTYPLPARRSACSMSPTP